MKYKNKQNPEVHTSCIENMLSNNLNYRNEMPSKCPPLAEEHRKIV